MINGDYKNSYYFLLGYIEFAKYNSPAEPECHVCFYQKKKKYTEATKNFPQKTAMTESVSSGLMKLSNRDYNGSMCWT